ncbi:MAG: ABC transporter permease [Candidatus Dormibacteraeota bacterium]|nr:ABC transporter permease [Candidatus Dormibacteraeota bacterium]
MRVLVWVGGRVGAVVAGAALVSAVLFFGVHMLPGDPVLRSSHQTPLQYQQALHRAGLDLPIWQQYLHVLQRLLDGDLANQLLPEALNSAKLGLLAAVVAVGLGVPIGYLAASHHNRWVDRVSMLLAFVGFAMPTFLWGSLLVLLFVSGLYQLSQGFLAYDIGPCCSPTQIWLPALALGLPFVGYIARMTRASMLDAIALDHVTAARARGLPERTVLSRHVLRYAAVPVLTVSGPLVGGLFVGSLVIEKIFGMPGLGHELAGSILGRDYDVAVAVFVYYALLVGLANVVVDVLHRMLDPRIRSA